MKEESTLDKVMHLSIGTLSRYQISKLYSLIEQAKRDLESAKRAKRVIELAISIKYEEHIKAKRLRLQKDSGIVRLQDKNYQLSCDIPKKVEWNQKKVQSIMATLLSKGICVDDFIETKYNIPESKFKNCSLSFQEILTPARTVRFANPVYKLVKLDGGVL